MGASYAHLGCCRPRPKRLDGRDSAAVDPEPRPARSTPWSSMAHYPVGRLPGYARDCKSLEVLDDLQEDHLCEWDLPAWEAPQCQVHRGA